mmetsp:Transcript_7471/g.11887  ORF Transcript_7471/g.11887 Transcript_7471/m.11887 type:complete len:212 (-) Transcript_7471:279-914(-)
MRVLSPPLNISVPKCTCTTSLPLRIHRTIIAHNLLESILHINIPLARSMYLRHLCNAALHILLLYRANMQSLIVYISIHSPCTQVIPIIILPQSALRYSSSSSSATSWDNTTSTNLSCFPTICTTSFFSLYRQISHQSTATTVSLRTFRWCFFLLYYKNPLPGLLCNTSICVRCFSIYRHNTSLLRVPCLGLCGSLGDFLSYKVPGDERLL